MTRRVFCFFVVYMLGCACAQIAHAQRSWDDAGNDASKLWDDNGNWNPDGDPDGDSVRIGNLANAADDTTLVDRAYIIDSLTLTNGADVVNSTDNGATNDHQLLVNGLTTISDAGSTFFVIGGDADGLDTEGLTINSGGTLNLNSTTAQGRAFVEIESGVLDLNSGGTIIGQGQIDFEDPAAVLTTVFSNEGTLTAHRGSSFIFSPPVADTLRLNDGGNSNRRFDWDGLGGGVINIHGNQTLDVDISTGNDAWSGGMNLSAGATLDMRDAWSMDSGTIDANTPDFGLIIIGQDPNPGPAAVIAGANWTMSGGTITIDDTWDSLQFDSQLVASGGVINNSGTMIWNGGATIQSGVDFNMLGTGASLVVNSALNIDTPDFNLDGAESGGNITTINAGGILDLDLGAGADSSFGHTINMNGGELDVTTSVATAWQLNSDSTINAAGGATSTINHVGETLEISGAINVTANSRLHINSGNEFFSDATVVVDAGSTLDVNEATYNGGSYTGGGLLRPGTATIAAATTWATDTVKLDDGTITANANLSVNTNAIDTGGDGYDGSMNIADAALVTVNIGGGGSWTVDPAGTINYNGVAGENTFLAGSNLVLNGTLNILGSGQSDAVLNIGTGTVNLNSSLVLHGGDNSTNPNTLAGGTINGPGTLSSFGARALEGFGSIGAPINFSGPAQLKADDGILSLTGAINDVGVIGTQDADGILDVPAAWNTSVADHVDLIGGELRGGAVTIDNPEGITGFGLVSARVINNTRIRAQGGQTLVVETAGNNNEWDGFTNTGELSAGTGNLELRDNAPFLFHGTVSATNGRQVFANGFELEFEPASTLALTGSSYRSTHATDIGGTVTTGAGTSTLQIGGTATFENGSSTTLIGDLQLDNAATRIDGGATFSGAGALINIAGRPLTLADGADVDVLLQNEGTLVLGASAGQTQGLDFEQSSTGTWDLELGGTGLSDYDRMTLTGIASLGGTLALSLIDGYVPTSGDPAFTILSASSVGGTFDTVLQPAGMPTGLFFDVVYNAANVQLMVIDQLLGDYNQNGIVDAADYTEWRDTLGNAVTAFTGADGDGDGMIDNDDYVVWKDNFGAMAASGATGSVSADAPVPEPQAYQLLLLAIVAIVPKIRRSIVAD